MKQNTIKNFTPASDERQRGGKLFAIFRS